MSTSPLLTTAKAFYAALGAFELDRAASFLAPEYEHEFLPPSAGLGPLLDSTALIGRFTALKAIIASFDMTVIQAWPNDDARTITLFGSSKPKFKDAVKRPEDVEGEWDYTVHAMFVITMDESCEKLTKLVEFVEVPATEKMKVQVAKAFQRGGDAQ